MKKVVTVIGARPQFVKAAVLSKIIKEYNTIQEIIIHTGQHFDANMSAVFFEEMMIPKPAYNLEINSLSHAAMTGQMMGKIEEILEIERPEALIVYGDTNSTIAGALAAKKMNIKVIHIEAGLRSFNMKMPEEINRLIIDELSDLFFVTEPSGVKNLANEKKDIGNVHFVGNTMIDSLVQFQPIFEKSKILDKLKVKSKEYFVFTFHRPGNVDDLKKLSELVAVIKGISINNKVVCPLDLIKK